MTYCLLEREQLLSRSCVCEWREGSWKTLGVLEKILSLKKTIKGAYAGSMHTLLWYLGTEPRFRCARLSCSAFGSCRYSQMRFRSQVIAILSCLLLASHKVNISGERECYYWRHRRLQPRKPQAFDLSIFYYVHTDYLKCSKICTSIYI